jgi:hypothetical protein
MTSTEVDISDLFNNDLNTIRMTPDKKAAGIDIVMIATGKNNNHATIINLKKEDSDGIGIVQFFRNLETYQFSGPGQRKIYVLNASETIELLMMLPGKKARAFRMESAGLLTRLFAGDPTLHDLIVKNGLSDGAMNQFARAEVVGNQAAVGITDEEVQLTKKILMATMRQELDEIEKKRTVSQLEVEENKQKITISQLEHVSWLCEQCVVGAPESQKRWMEESNRNFKISVFNACVSSSIRGGQLGIENGQTDLGGPVYTDDMQPVTISTHIIMPKGLRDPDNKMAMAIGTVAAEMYGDWNEGAKPFKEKIIIRGYPVDVNKYFKKDLPLLEAAFVKWEKRAGVVASQKLEKAQKLKERELKKRVKEREKAEKLLRKQAEDDVVDEDNRRKSNLLANQPSMYKYWR